MKITHVLINSIKPYPKNYNKHPESQVDSLAASAAEFEQVKNIVVWRGKIIAGEGFWRGMIRAGQKSIAVADVSEWTEAKARAYMVADNEIAKLAEPDMVELSALLDGLKLKDFDLAALAAGGADNLKALTLPAIQQGDAEPQFDRAAELQEKWHVKTGDLWRIGEHRLLCGDSTKREDVERVMQGERAQLVVTSPPYGVGKDYEHGGIDEWLQLIRGCFSCCVTIASTWFVNLANRRTGNNGYEANTFALMEREFESLSVKLISLRIWIKDPAWVGQNPYWTQTYKPVDDFEFLGTFAREKPKFKKRLTDAEYRDWGWRGIWEMASVKQNDIHSAMFPVELPSRAVKLLTDDSETVYEPFTGSGTTIVACQNLGRKCRAIEIAPQYVAVCLERMATAFSGIEIERL